MTAQAHRRTRPIQRPLRALAALALLSPALLSLALPAGATTAPLSGDEIRTLIVGNTVIGPWLGKLYDFSYSPDGELVGTAGADTDGGRWHIRDGNVYCHEWSTFFGGYERCYQWFDTGKGRFTLKNVDTFKILDLDVWRIRPGLN